MYLPPCIFVFDLIFDDYHVVDELAVVEFNPVATARDDIGSL